MIFMMTPVCQQWHTVNSAYCKKVKPELQGLSAVYLPFLDILEFFGGTVVVIMCAHQPSMTLCNGVVPN